MTRHALLLALFSLLLLIPSCRHRAWARGTQRPYYSHEEAEPVSNLPQPEFSKVTPGHQGR